MMDDLIRRQDAVDAMYKHFNYDVNDDLIYWNREHVLRVLKDLPSAEPDSKESSLTQKALDIISRQDAIDAVKKHYRIDNDLLELIAYEIEQLPSAQSKQLQVLANVLDGCPLTQPCDKMWKPEGWCKEHCKPGQQEPDAECWLKYAEVMASEQ